ncbi:MAG: glycosyltransferase family 9 protein [Chitinophagales bacterium]|nr:glycosyltransferase family 9 protein [Chitinophagales bacterium]
MKVLILRFSSIGDIVLTSTVVRCLKLQQPQIELHYATKASYVGILESNPHIDKIHLLKDDINALISSLQAENFDLVLDLHNNLRTQIIKLRLRVKSYSVNKLNFEKWLLTQFKINKLPKYKHIVDRYLYTAKTLGIVNDAKGLDYFIPSKDEVIIENLFVTAKESYIALVIGAKFATKRMPFNKLLELCDQIDLPIILLGGLDDLARGEELSINSTNKEIYNACGKLNLNQSASVIRQATLVITHDTGLMHIAAAFQKNIISIWGNTVPELGMYPYMSKDKFKAVEVKDLSCRPCSKIGHKKCPKGHFDCMQKIDTKEILSEMHYYLKPVE